MRVLVADDSPTIRADLCRRLASWGHEVVEAADGQSAWLALNSPTPPRIAILDWMMPGMDGAAICRRMRDRATAPFIYTVLLTSRRDEEGLVNALDNGAHGFLVKPVAAEELRGHVNVGQRLVESEDQLKRYAGEMERLATTDPLTGVSNRRHFFDHAQRELIRSHRYHHALCVLILDLDHFKRINDTCGHAAGDEVLRGAANACRATLRQNDLFARIGGEEFVALLPETNEAAGVEAAERLRAAIRAIPAPALIGPVTASVGVAACAGKNETIDTLLHRADEALYRAKAQGRDRAATWSSQSAKPPRLDSNTVLPPE